MELLFDKKLGFSKRPNLPVTLRTAVRAVIKQDGKLLLLKSNKGDCKLPGGGVDPNENFEQALIREVAEETGYVETRILYKIGRVVECKIDEYNDQALFEMDSHYYLCEISDVQVEQSLDAYEEDLDFTPVWLTLDDAVQMNEKHLSCANPNGWAKRENEIFKQLKAVVK